MGSTTLDSKVSLQLPEYPQRKIPFLPNNFPSTAPLFFSPWYFTLMVESFNTTYEVGSGRSGAILGCHGNETCLSKLGHFSCCLFYARLSLISFSLTLP